MRPPAALLLLLLSLRSAAAQQTGPECLAQFKNGQDDFVLDADESVKNGATFISSPKLGRYKDCVVACCKEPKCNVAFMEKEDEEGLIKSCFLFDCLYKQKYACRFVRKKGYINYILDSVYESYLEVDFTPGDADRPPVANGGPDQVVQPQDTVTLNGIQSKDDKGIVSYQWKFISGYPYAVIEKTNFDDQIYVSNLTSGKYKFQLTVTDTSGQSDSTGVNVLVLTPEQSEHHCMVPMKVGPCRGAFPRWHYNGASEECEPFMFGGCRENLNNYLTKDECTNACYGTEKTGTGRGLPVPAPGEKCGTPCTTEQFTCANGCCLDPGLECDSIPQCSDKSDEQKCEDLRCTELPNTGNCRDSLTKWYYNPVKQDCFRFNYGGCRGNENRFDSKESCMTVCRGITESDVFARQVDYERSVSKSQTGIIVAAAVLGLAIIILLGLLVYCFMKGKKKSPQHHRVPINNAPVSSMEDREHLVYNTTTKPI
ncbi:hypothetical protein PAMP_005459 [Pampus punctatissimus]